MQTKIQNHGFKTIQVNGIEVYTCNLAIKRDEFPYDEATPEIDGVRIYPSHKLMGKNKKEVPVFIIRYATTDFKQHTWMKTSVINLLQEHAYTQITRKYAAMRGELPETSTETTLRLDEDGDLPY